MEAGPAVAMAIGLSVIWLMMITCIIAAFRFRDR